MIDTTAAWSALDNITPKEDVVPDAVQTVADQVVSDKPRDEAYTYSTYEVLYALPPIKKGDTPSSGSLVPGQFLPLWQPRHEGKVLMWDTLSVARIIQRTALAYNGGICVAGTEPEHDDQVFGLEAYVGTGDEKPNLEDLEKRFSRDKALLMAPGGRTLVNVQEQFPCVCPWLKHNHGQADRLLNSMSPFTWADMYARVPLASSDTPGLYLVVVSDDASADKIATSVTGHEQPVRLLELPVTLEYGEYLLDVSSGDGDLQEIIETGISFYFQTHKDLIGTVGLYWDDQDKPGTAYRQGYHLEDKFEVRRMGGARYIKAFQNGTYEPDLM